MPRNKNKKSFLKTIFGYDDLINNLKFTKKIITEDVKKENFKESFEDALERLNIKEEDKNNFLTKKYNEIRKISLYNYIFSFIMILIFAINISDSSFFHKIISLLFSFYFLLKGFELSLRCYQIKNRKLGLLKEFFRDVKNWIPKKNF